VLLVVIATAVAFAERLPLGDVEIETTGALVYPYPSLINVI